jgi:type II secretion system protein H
VLVVVAIAAVMSALVILRLGTWRAPDRPDIQLERFGALLETQCEQAMFQARPRGLRVTDEGYDFWQATASGWVALSPDGLTRPRNWSADVIPELMLDAYRVDLDEEASNPQIICQPLGEMTRFELVLRNDEGHWRMTGQARGQLALAEPGS